MIPNVVQMIWIGRHFPYVNRLAVESVLLADPETVVRIHYADPPENEQWQALQRLERVEFIPIDFEKLLEPWKSAPKILQQVDQMAASYLAGRSNILRYLILYLEGGVYLDFDILMLRPFGDLLEERGFIGEELVFRADDERVQRAPFRIGMTWEYPAFLFSWGITRFNSYFCRNSRPLNALSELAAKIWGIKKLNNAVLGAEPEHPFFRRAIEAIPERDPTIQYGMGPILMNQIWSERDWSGEMRRMESKAFYAVPPSQTHRFFGRHEERDFSESVLIHWCSSNEKEKAAQLLPELLDSEPSSRALLIHKLAWPTICARQQLKSR